ncbi:MAG TPA: hypothetical protein VHN99_08320 [Deinococcales bacterium]|nr:hypothetical protein [Deinococcales bacterium]
MNPEQFLGMQSSKRLMSDLVRGSGALDPTTRQPETRPSTPARRTFLNRLRLA